MSADFTASRELEREPARELSREPARKERGGSELVNDLQTNLVINKEVIKGLIEAQSSTEPFKKLKTALHALN